MEIFFKRDWYLRDDALGDGSFWDVSAAEFADWSNLGNNFDVYNYVN